MSSPARGSSATRRGYVPLPRRPRGGRTWTDCRLRNRDLSQSPPLIALIERLDRAHPVFRNSSAQRAIATGRRPVPQLRTGRRDPRRHCGRARLSHHPEHRLCRRPGAGRPSPALGPSGRRTGDCRDAVCRRRHRTARESTCRGRLMYSHYALLERQSAGQTVPESGPLADELITPRQRALDRRHRRRSRRS
jgi:hypothetical protein